MTDPGDQFDATRAELFEALGHPIRVKILQALETKSMGFAELKKEVSIESSGHLEFHLRKLSGLVGTTAEGSYALTDDGKEAIRVLKSVPANHGGPAPRARFSIFARSEWTKPLLAILLISIVVLAGVAIYEQEQIATMGRELPTATVSIGGTRYYYEALPLLSNGSTLKFHGVTFTVLTVPYPNGAQSNYNTRNYTYAGSVRLTNGTLLNLTGKTVIEQETGFCYFASNGNSTGEPLCYPTVGMSVTFPDGSQAVYAGYNLTAQHQNGNPTIINTLPTPVYVLTYGMWPPMSSPWFTQENGLAAGFFFNARAFVTDVGAPAVTLYVSVPT